GRAQRGSGKNARPGAEPGVHAAPGGAAGGFVTPSAQQKTGWAESAGTGNSGESARLRPAADQSDYAGTDGSYRRRGEDAQRSGVALAGVGPGVPGPRFIVGTRRPSWGGPTETSDCGRTGFPGSGSALRPGATSRCG